MDTRQRDEIRELARLTAQLTCSQQTFFQAEYGRHRRSPTTALVLCLLLGGFGAHEFYFGRHRSAVLRLVFFWTLIPALMALFELPGVVAHARRYNAILGQRIYLAIGESATETPRETRVAAQVDPATEHEEVRIGTAEYDMTDGSTRLRRVSEQLAAALTLDRARQATQPGVEIEKADEPHLEESSAEDLRLAATTAPFWEAELPIGAFDDEEADEALEPNRVPVLNYSTAVVRRDPVRLGPALPIDAALPAAWAPERAVTSEDVVVPTQPAPQLVTRHHVQRIIVRKMALQDGKIAAEAVAERMVELEGTEEDIERRVEQATEEARQEALRSLALSTTGEVSEAAWSSLHERYPDADQFA